MFGDELDGFGRLRSFRRQQYGVGAFAFASTTLRADTDAKIRVDLAVDLAVRMMEVRQFHHLHLALRFDGTKIIPVSHISREGLKRTWAGDCELITKTRLNSESKMDFVI